MENLKKIKTFNIASVFYNSALNLREYNVNLDCNIVIEDIFNFNIEMSPNLHLDPLKYITFVAQIN